MSDQQPPSPYGDSPAGGSTPPPPPPSSDPYGTPPAGQDPYGQNPYGAPPGGAPMGAPVGGAAYASWIKRVGAYLIDSIITAVPYFVLAGIGGAVKGGAGGLLVFLGFLVSLGVFIWNTCMKGGGTGYSIGKGALGIKLIKEATGEPIGAGMAFVRQLAHIVDSIICDIGYLWPLWDSKRQTLADKIMSTVVIEQPKG